MGPDHTSRVLFGVAAGTLGSLFVAAGLVGIRGEIANVNVALILVLGVLGASILGGRTAGSMSGLVAATAFDFFHTRPHGSLKVAGLNDLVTTLLLLVAGLAMGNVAERSGQFKARLKDDQRHLRRLRRVAGLAASGAVDERDLVLTVTAELVDTLGLEDCWFEVPPFVAELPFLESDGSIPGSSGHHPRGSFDLPGDGLELRVVGRGITVGRFILVPAADRTVSPERLVVAVALADELGLVFAATAS